MDCELLFVSIVMSGISPTSNSIRQGPATYARPAAAPSKSVPAFSVPSAPKGSTEVETQRTPLNGEQAKDALSAAWRNLYQEEATPETLSVLVAQWSHETGAGRSMMNYNFGGIKGAGPSGLTTACRTKEGSGDSERRIVDHFRAYRSADEGATDYLRLLHSRFPQAVEAAKSGDSQAFVHSLKAKGYFTGSEQAYTRSVSSIAGQALERGFDSIGSVSGPTERLVQPSVSDSYEPIPATELQRVSVQAFTDEIVRSALRIAGTTGTESPEDALFGRF